MNEVVTGNKAWVTYQLPPMVTPNGNPLPVQLTINGNR